MDLAILTPSSLHIINVAKTKIYRSLDNFSIMWFLSPSEFQNNIHHVYTASYGGFGAQSIGAPDRRADRRVDRRVEWYRCLKLDMHIL